MPKIKLEASIIPTLYCPPGKPNEKYFDEAVTGFIVEMRPNGAGTYALRYKDPYNRQRQYKIAAVGDITFAEAKKEAIRIRSRVVVGKNPQEERQANRRIPTIAELADRYLDYVRTYKRSHDIDERYLRIQCDSEMGEAPPQPARPDRNPRMAEQQGCVRLQASDRQPLAGHPGPHDAHGKALGASRCRNQSA